jgi:hypothetical protein
VAADTPATPGACSPEHSTSYSPATAHVTRGAARASVSQPTLAPRAGSAPHCRPPHHAHQTVGWHTAPLATHAHTAQALTQAPPGRRTRRRTTARRPAVRHGVACDWRRRERWPSACTLTPQPPLTRTTPGTCSRALQASGEGRPRRAASMARHLNAPPPPPRMHQHTHARAHLSLRVHVPVPGRPARALCLDRATASQELQQSWWWWWWRCVSCAHARCA